jgi:hypothetical protein
MNKLLTPAKDAPRLMILGTGASAADGAPLQAGLFRKYAEIIRRTQDSYVHAASEGELRRLFSLFWPANIDAGRLG